MTILTGLRLWITRHTRPHCYEIPSWAIGLMRTRTN